MSKSEYEIKKAFFLSAIAAHWKSVLFSLLIILVFSALIFRYALGERQETKLIGKVIGLTASQDETGPTLYLIVKTENNKQALTRIHKSVPYKKGCQVLIKKVVIKSMLETEQYWFLKYTDDSCRIHI